MLIAFWTFQFQVEWAI